jgi:hypothetical protein
MTDPYHFDHPSWQGRNGTCRSDPEAQSVGADSTEGLLPGALEEQMAVYTAVTYALASSNAGPSLNSNGVVEWGIKNILPLILLMIGIGIIASARKGRISDNANTLTNVVLGMGVIAGAAVLYTFASGLTDLVFGTG